MRNTVAWLLAGVALGLISASAAHGQESAQNALAEVRSFRATHEAEIVNELVEFLRLPNVATKPEDIQRNAELLKKMMERRGIRTEILPTDTGQPVIFGELPVAGATSTLLFYCHYDGQAADPNHWHSDPFQPVLRAAPDVALKPIAFPAAGAPYDDNWRLYARSAADDKAPIVALLTALDALRAQGRSPAMNLKFLFEGEEEQGSPGLAAFVGREKDRLAADLIVMADGPVHPSGRPTLFYGARGILTLQLTVYGPTENLHSGHYGNWAPNPAMRLAHLLATMKDARGLVTIAGFYNNVEPLGEKEKQALAEVPPVEAGLQEKYGIAEPEGEGKSLAELITLPSLNVDGLASGWVGSESRTIVPRSATAALDIRLVKGMDYERTFQRVLAHIRGQGWHVVTDEPTPAERQQYGRLVRVVQSDGYNASRIPMDFPPAERVARAVARATGGTLVRLPTVGGSGPMHDFELVGMPSLGVPTVNYDNNQHGPDENLRLGNLFQAVDVFASILMGEPAN